MTDTTQTFEQRARQALADLARLPKNTTAEQWRAVAVALAEDAVHAASVIDYLRKCSDKLERLNEQSHAETMRAQDLAEFWKGKVEGVRQTVN
jgi:hypothetical protein